MKKAHMKLNNIYNVIFFSSIHILLALKSVLKMRSVIRTRVQNGKF